MVFFSRHGVGRARTGLAQVGLTGVSGRLASFAWPRRIFGVSGRSRASARTALARLAARLYALASHLLSREDLTAHASGAVLVW